MAKAEPAQRVAPHNLEAEEALLGAMLLSRDAIDAGLAGCTGDDFYRGLHGAVFDAIRDLYLSGEPCDPVTVAHELRNAQLEDSVGGLSALLSLQANTPATSNAAAYAAVVRDAATLRRLIGAGTEIADLGYENPDDVAAAVDRAEGLLYEVRDRNRAASGSVGLADALRVWLDEVDTDDPAPDLGLTTGLAAVDAKLVGMRPGELVIVGARPAMGKTCVAVHLARVAATIRPDEVAVYVSLEMLAGDLTQRFAAQDARVSLEHLRRRQLTEADWMRMSKAMARLADAPIVLHDDPSVTLSGVRGAARRAARRSRLSVLIVDYLQLMEPERASRGENRQVDVAAMSRGLKVLARELRCPVVALSSLSRRVEERAEKRPLLSDLRESGGLEADADVVMLLYRDEVYDAKTEHRGTMEIHVAKQRNGPTGTVRVLCDMATGRLWDVPAEDRAEPLSMAMDG